MNAGKLKIFRIFDIAHEVNFDEAQQKLERLGPTSKYTLKKPSKDFLFGDPPIVLSLGAAKLGEIEVQVSIKIWSYGAVSFSLTLDCDVKSDKKDYVSWLAFWFNNTDVDSFCESKLNELIQALGKSLKKPKVWDQTEEYSVFMANPSFQSREFWEEENFVFQFLSMEKEVSLSPEMIQPIKDCSLSYSSQDLAIIDWDNAFVLSSDDAEDICDVIELANVQLLELRFFDDLLDKKLSGLYRQVVERKPTIFNSTISLLAQDASQLYIETSEVVERIENSLKVVGDIYFARLYRLSLKRLQVPQWQGTVDQKLNNLLDVSQMYMGELHTKRSHLMEIIIIILITIEVVPFLYPFVKSYLIR